MGRRLHRNETYGQFAMLELIKTARGRRSDSSVHTKTCMSSIFSPAGCSHLAQRPFDCHQSDCVSMSEKMPSHWVKPTGTRTRKSHLGSNHKSNTNKHHFKTQTSDRRTATPSLARVFCQAPFINILRNFHPYPPYTNSKKNLNTKHLCQHTSLFPMLPRSLHSTITRSQMK